MRRSRAVLILCLLAVAGCAREEDTTPSGCLTGEDAVVEALAAAPDRVRIEGTPLSACLRDTTDGGELQEVGTAYLEAASTLADRAAAEPEGAPALQLGYLLGAVERSETGAQGVGYELGRRLRAEAARTARGSKAFARGRRAGRDGG